MRRSVVLLVVLLLAAALLLIGGEAWLLDSRNNYLDVAGSSGKLVAAIGIEDLVVVDCPDALLIARRDRAQDVSKVVQWLEKHKRDELL